MAFPSTIPTMFKASPSVTISNSPAGLCPLEWNAAKVYTSTGSLDPNQWFFDPGSNSGDTNSATLSLRTSWESDSKLLKAFMERAQLTIKVRFSDGSADTLVLNLEP